MIAAKERWYDVIAARHSTRGFNRQPIEPDKLEQIKSVCQDFRLPAARAALATEGVENIFVGAIGPYGKVKGAPCYIAFVGDMSNPNAYEQLGYVGEGIVLEATGLGLATCWVAGFFRAEAAAKNIELKENERVLAVTPIGYARSGVSIDDRLAHLIAKSPTRKPLSKLSGGLPYEEWPDWIKSAIEAARLAPSAVNRQPWRFTVAKDSITVSVDNLEDTHKIPKRLDCGIAMLHIEVTAKYLGIEGQWEYLPSPGVAKFSTKELLR